MKYFVFVMMFVCSFLYASGSTSEVRLKKNDKFIEFGNSRLSIRIDAKTGAWSQLSADGKVLAEGNRDYAFHLRVGELGAIRSLRKTEFLSARKSEDRTLEVKVRASDGKENTRTWIVLCYYRIEPDNSLYQTFRFTCDGTGREKIRRFSQRSPYLKLNKESEIVVPTQVGSLNPYRAGDIISKRAKESWGRFLIAQIDPDFTILGFAEYKIEYGDQVACGTLEDKTGFQIGRDSQTLGWVEAGKFQQLGDFRTFVRRENRQKVLESLSDVLKTYGWTLPEKSPEWLRYAAIYSTHPNGTILSLPYSRTGFSELKEVNLPHVMDLGCNLYHLLPVEEKSPYCPYDYRKLADRIGTPDEYRAFVKAAHDNKIKVFQDIVPHGGPLYTDDRGRTKTERAVKLEHLTIINENGKPQRSLIFDYDLPEWQKYMYDVAVWCMKEYNLDGFRIDAVSRTQGVNWRAKDIRAGFSHHRGGVAMQKTIRDAVKSIRPEDGGTLAETARIEHGSTSDILYDFTLYCNVLPKIGEIAAEQFVPFLRNFLHEQWFGSPRGALTMRYVESHDTVKAEMRWNLAPMRSLFAVTVWSWGVPLVNNELDNGSGEIFRRILRLRRDLPEMGGGEPDYLAPQVPKEIFACLRKGENYALPLVNFSDKKVSFLVKIPASILPEKLRNVNSVRNYWDNSKIAVKRENTMISVPVTLDPYGMALLRFEKTPAKVETSKFTVGKNELPVETYFLNPDGTITEKSDFFTVSANSDGTYSLKSLKKDAPEGGVLFRIPVENGARCSWQARSATGLHQDYWRVRFPNSTGVLTGINRLYFPQDGNVLWSSLDNPFGFTGNEAWTAFSTPKGSVRFEFDVNNLPGNVSILDHVAGKNGKAPYLFIGFRAGHGAFPNESGQEIKFRRSVSKAESLFAFGSGDSRLKIVPGAWIFDDGKLRAQMTPNGMLASLEEKQNGKWTEILSNMELSAMYMWSPDKMNRTSAESLESRRQLKRLADGTLVIRFNSFPRNNLRVGFWGKDRVVEYQTEYRFSPSGSMDILLGARSVGSEYFKDFNVKAFCNVKNPSSLKVFAGKAEVAKGKMSFQMFNGPIPVPEIGKWKFIGLSVGNSSGGRVPDDRPSAPFKYCMDPGFELCTLSAVRMTLQNQRTYFDWIHSSPSIHAAECASVQPEQDHLTVDVKNPFSGDACLGVIGKKGETRFAAQPLRRSYFTAGSKWTFTGYFRTENLKKGALVIGTQVDGKFTESARMPIEPGSLDWKKYIFTFTAPATGLPYCRIENNDEGIVYADEFSFTPESPIK